MDTREKIGRGETLFSSGKIEAAKDVFKQIVKEDPDNFEAVNNLGAVCYTLGDERSAEAHFLRALEVSLAYTVKRLSERYSGLSDDTYNECIHLKSYRDLWDSICGEVFFSIDAGYCGKNLYCNFSKRGIFRGLCDQEYYI
jgi:tetratricopeptide (TPR) repeat protein